MANIVETSIKKPLIIGVIFTILTLGGLLCYNMLNLNLLPKMDVPVITIATVYPGAGASEVESSVTKKIEDAVSSLENLDKVNSTSREGVSIVTVMLNENTDINRSVQDATRKINAIKSSLPKDILDPSIDKISIDDQPILRVAAFSSLPSTEFYKLMEDRIQPRLAKLQGVATVNMSGGSEREIEVNINAQKLQTYNLSILQVLQAIQTANMEIPAGNIETSDITYSVRLAAKYANLDELRNTVILSIPNGGEIRVNDVAEVKDGVAKTIFINRIDGKDAIALTVQKQSDANAVQVAGFVKDELTTIENEYAGSNVKFEIATDESVFTRASANSVVFDLFLAILIVAIVCFVFLHNIRSALIIMVAVPLSIIPAFIALFVMGYSLNMMSLLALSLVVGILVDDSIVVIENMYHHLERGKSKRQAALDGCKQIMFTVMAITLVIVVVFLPLTISGGTIGNILKEFAIPIIAATLTSLLVSFTVTPLLMSRFGKLSDDTRPTLSARFSRTVEKAFENIKDFYVRILSFGLKYKILILTATIVLLIGSFTLFPMGLIGVAFVPEIDQGEFKISLDMNPQITVYQNNQITIQVEKILLGKPEIQRVYTNVGSDGNGFGSASKNNATSISVKMVDKKDRDTDVHEFAQQIKQEIMTIPGIRARVSVAGLVGGGGIAPIQLIVQGADYEKVEVAAAMLLETVKKTPGTADAKLSIDDPKQEVQVKLNRDKMSQLGLSSADVGSALRVALAGNNDSKYTDGNYEYNIRVGVDNFDKTNVADVSKLTLLNNRGELIELNQIAGISYGLGPSMLERTNRIASIAVSSNVVGRPSGTVGSEIMTAIAGQIPEGVTIQASGMMEQQSKAFGSLGISFLSAIVLIYLIMVVLYNSLSDPLVVLVSIPLSFIGAFLALGLTLNELSIFSIIGLIVLIGLVAKNAILLVDFTNHIRSEQNMDTFHALIEAGKERLRPILMTTFAMIFGMLPIALATGNGAELKNGMAWVIIGGLTSSMLLTLVVVPVVYYCVDRIKVRFRREKCNLVSSVC